ncbi:MAG: hypothetical protein DME22_19430 [Verrucomicrobia bacterium]|nr:MAG: hypothetical protein DME22_19430 [Verrucomicrobiota bacterium]
MFHGRATGPTVSKVVKTDAETGRNVLAKMGDQECARRCSFEFTGEYSTDERNLRVLVSLA